MMTFEGRMWLYRTHHQLSVMLAIEENEIWKADLLRALILIHVLRETGTVSAGRLTR